MFLQNSNTPTKVVESASQVTNVAYSSIDNLVKSFFAKVELMTENQNRTDGL